MSNLTDARRVILEARLAKAEEAYDDLMTGGAVRVVVDQNGERMEYAPTTSSRLAMYINSLKLELGLIETQRPARIFFR